MPFNNNHKGTLTHLGKMPIEEFLANYWQKKPLLIRQAFPGFSSPVSAEELAGFALEENIESRLIQEQPATDPLQSDWQIQHGPLPENIFSQLGESHWTLLVQAVDQLVPEVTELLERFRFVPNWRLDDIMVSYAADQGSVGPHYDYYDVFLLQAQGQRRWQLGQHCDAASQRRFDTAMNILSQFEHQADYLLHPGDMLYIPPQLAHWGIAEGACMTYSIGFRAPSYSDLLLDFAQETAAELSEDQRYTDRNLQPQAHPGEITDDAVTAMQNILLNLVQDKAHLAHWLAAYGTRAKRVAPELECPPRPDATAESSRVALKSSVRAVYIPAESDQAVVYLDGERYDCSLALAQYLTSYRPLALGDFTQPAELQLLNDLLDNQWLVSLDGG